MFDGLFLLFLLQPQSQVQKANISPASDEHVLDQLSQCEEKLMKLMEELDASGKGMDEIVREMEDEEVRVNMMQKACNSSNRARLYLLCSARPWYIQRSQ